MFSKVGLALFAAATSTASAETLYQYLFESGRVPSNLGKSLEIARAERERIGELGVQFPGAAVFLPVDEAWNTMPEAYDALMNEPSGNVRYDLLLASSIAVPKGVVRDAPTLLSYSQAQKGIVDTAYGSSYTIPSTESVCAYVWTREGYKTGDCARIMNHGVALDDAAVFFIDKVLLPQDIELDVENLIEMSRRRRRRV